MALGPNDIEAKLVLTDETSARVKDVEKNVKTATSNMARDASKTTKVFDGWNFSLNVFKLGLKGLKIAASKDADFADILNEGATALVYSIERLVAIMTPGVTSIEDFRAKVREFGRELASANITEELTGLNEALHRIESIDASKLHLALQPLFDSPERYKMVQESVAAFEDQIKTAKEKTEFLAMATKDLANDGLGLSRKEADALWASMQKVKEAHAKAAEATNDLADSHDAAAEAALKQREAEEALLRTFGGGWNRAVSDLEDSFLVAGQAASRFAHEAHGTISNDLFAALKGEAVSFSSFMTHILDGILKQFTDAAAAGLLGSFTGGGGGGLLGALFGGGSSSASGGASGFSSNRYSPYYPGNPLGPPSNAFPSLERYAFGGIAEGPTTGYLAILHGREKITPMNGEGGGAPVVNFTIVNPMDGPSIERLFSSPGFRRAVGDNVAHAMRNRADVRGTVYDG